MTAWWCATCGRVEAPERCIGVCIFRPEEMVSAPRHGGVLAEAVAARRDEQLLAGPVRPAASVTPRDGQWERTWRAVQQQMRAVLGALASRLPALGEG